MTERIKTLTQQANISILTLALLSFPAAAQVRRTDPTANESGQPNAGHESAAPARLVELVRNATRQCIDVNAALAHSGVRLEALSRASSKFK